MDPESGGAADTAHEILARWRRVAVVGLSPRPSRPSHGVASYLQAAGYEITPVNPTCDEVLGIACVPDLKAAARRGPVEIVDVFRREEMIPGVVEDAIAVGAKAVWMQLGLRHERAAARAREAGLAVVMDRCIKIEHARHFGG